MPPMCRACAAQASTASPLPMVTTAGAWHIVRYVDPAFCRLVGKSEDELLGTPFAEIAPVASGLPSFDRVYRTGEAETHTEQEQSIAHPAYWSYAMWPVLRHRGTPGGSHGYQGDRDRTIPPAGGRNEPGAAVVSRAPA